MAAKMTVMGGVYRSGAGRCPMRVLREELCRTRSPAGQWYHAEELWTMERHYHWVGELGRDRNPGCYGTPRESVRGLPI